MILNNLLPMHELRRWTQYFHFHDIRDAGFVVPSVAATANWKARPPPTPHQHESPSPSHKRSIIPIPLFPICVYTCQHIPSLSILLSTRRLSLFLFPSRSLSLFLSFSLSYPLSLSLFLPPTSPFFLSPLLSSPLLSSLSPLL